MGTPCFEDGIGRRWRSFEPAGGEIETLLLCPALAEAASTETALIERAARLAAFSHPAFAPVRRIERPTGTAPTLAIVSAAVPGMRLSEVLRDAQARQVPPDLDAACVILAQVATALADLHRFSRDLSHGAIGPERIVIGPDGRAVIVESVLAPMFEQLELARTPLWAEFRVPVPPVAGTARFDQVGDVMQLGVLALALVLGRPVRRDEYPNRLHDLMLEVAAPGAPADRQALLRSLRAWIHRTLQLEPRSAFRTASEAAPALEVVLSEGPRHKLSPASVLRYLVACGAEVQSDWKVPSALAMPTAGDARRAGVDAAAGRASASSRTAAGATTRVRRAASGAIPATTRPSTGRESGPRASLARGTARRVGRASFHPGAGAGRPVRSCLPQRPGLSHAAARACRTGHRRHRVTSVGCRGVRGRGRQRPDARDARICGPASTRSSCAPAEASRSCRSSRSQVRAASSVSTSARVPGRSARRPPRRPPHCRFKGIRSSIPVTVAIIKSFTIVGLALGVLAGGACDRAPAPTPPAPVRTDQYLRPEIESVSGRVPRNATLASLLSSLGLRADLVPAVVSLTRPVFDPRGLKTDHAYLLERTTDGLVRRFEYEIDEDRFLRILGPSNRQPEELTVEVMPYRKERYAGGRAR